MSKLNQKNFITFVRWVWTAIALLGSIRGMSQPDLGGELSRTIANNKPAILFRLESRNSFIANSGVHITGIKLGANYGPNLNMGLGFHYLNHKSAERIKRNLDQPLESKLGLEYVSFFMEYRFYNKGRYSASLPLQVGFGSASYRNSLIDLGQVSPVILYEAMLNGEMKFFKYFGAGAGLGYRICLLNNNAFGLRMNSPIYNVRFNVYFQELYRDLIK